MQRATVYYLKQLAEFATLLLASSSCRAFAAPAVLLTTVGQGVFRGISNMRAPLLITLATNAGEAAACILCHSTW